MANLPSVSHPTDRPNFYVMEIGALTIYYSYRTPIAFTAPGIGTVVRRNDWSVTTGKHLNYVDNGRKSDRISGADFEAQLAALTDTIG